jgi:hypothetical protein
MRLAIFRGFLDALLTGSYNQWFAAMSNSSWESTRSQPSNFCRVALIATALFVLIAPAVANPLYARLPRYRLPSAQSRGANAAADSVRSGIAGRIVDSTTGAPISGGQVIVALEQPDGTGTDTVFTQTSPDPSGRFSFSLLPLNTKFDVVAVAINGSGVAYDATIVVGVPSSDSDLGAIPLIAETGDETGPAKIEGIVTASAASGPSSIRVTVSAIQTIDLRDGLAIHVDVPQTVTLTGADYRPVTIPGEHGTSADILLRSASECPASMRNVNCGRYVIVAPGSNPNVGVFSGGKVSYQHPARPPALYSVRANAFMPYGTGASVCLPSFQSTFADPQGQPLKLQPAGAATAQPIAFIGCW